MKSPMSLPAEKQQQHPHRIVGARLFDGLGQGRIHGLCDGVLLVGPVERQGQDAVGQLGADMFAHVVSSSRLTAVHQSTPFSSRVRLARPRFSR